MEKGGDIPHPGRGLAPAPSLPTLNRPARPAFPNEDDESLMWASLSNGPVRGSGLLLRILVSRFTAPYFASIPDISFSPASMPFQGTPEWKGLPALKRQGR